MIPFLYLITNLLWAVYTGHIFLLLILYWRKERSATQSGDSAHPLPDASVYPLVTVQLPLYNEAVVASRLLEAVARLDYPRDRLQIQVLDDSTDETTAILTRLVAGYQQKGLAIDLIRRPDRSGFKGGALAYGMDRANGEFIAIFDADFVPQPDFLARTIPELVGHPKWAFVQARWGHLNADYSVITGVQSLAIDSHFFIDQAVRHWAGLPMHFNGTAGVWRRAAIEESGGWQHETLCEDLDLSYRALLQGWQPGYLPDLVAPAELPPQLAAFKQQQFRWAKGSIQCVKKLWHPLWHSSFPLWKKLISLVHLSGYTINFLVLLIVLLSPIFALVSPTASWLMLLGLLSFGVLAYPLYYLTAIRAGHPEDWGRVIGTRLFPLMLLGLGMTLNNSLAIFQGLFNVGQQVFRRTPKFDVIRAGDLWQENSYRLPLSGLVLGEIGVSLYCLGGALLAFGAGQYLLIPTMLLYALGFGYTAWVSIQESRGDVRRWLVALARP